MKGEMMIPLLQNFPVATRVTSQKTVRGEGSNKKPRGGGTEWWYQQFLLISHGEERGSGVGSHTGLTYIRRESAQGADQPCVA